MIAITRSGGARLLDGRSDLSLLAALLVGIANAEAHKRGATLADGSPMTFGAHSTASALSYLLAVDPPASDDDVVVWAWTEDPVAARHVTPPLASRADVERAMTLGKRTARVAA